MTNINIEEVSKADIDALCDIGLLFYREGNLGQFGLSFDRESISKYLSEMMINQNIVMLVAKILEGKNRVQLLVFYIPGFWK